MMATGWILVILYSRYNWGSAIDHIQMQSKDACLVAQANFNGWKAFCLNTETGEIATAPKSL